MRYKNVDMQNYDEDYCAINQVQSLFQLGTSDDGREQAGYPAYGSETDRASGEYTVGTMDSGGRTCEGHNYISGEHHGNTGGK